MGNLVELGLSGMATMPGILSLDTAKAEFRPLKRNCHSARHRSEEARGSGRCGVTCREDGAPCRRR